MSSPIKKVSGFLNKTNLMANVARKAGVSDSNFFRKLTDPAGGVIKAGEQGGFDGIKDYTAQGGITDPLNLFHRTPDNSSPEAPPAAADGSTQGMAARDRLRRRVYRAQGRASTIRSSGGGVLSNQAQLLGS